MLDRLRTEGDALRRDGFVVVERLEGLELEALRTEADRLLRGAAAGARNALGRSSLLRQLAEAGPVARLARSLLGEKARPVKLTLFDKSPAANWKVPWHQDRTIAVRERRERPEIAGFGPWSIKDGVPHVQPPIEVLEAILAIRVHLDDTPESNGALRVVPGSHRHGRLDAERIRVLRAELGEIACPVPAGGSMAMFPLLLHASSAAREPGRRRVLHYEFTAFELPGGLAWA